MKPWYYSDKCPTVCAEATAHGGRLPRIAREEAVVRDVGYVAVVLVG